MADEEPVLSVKERLKAFENPSPNKFRNDSSNPGQTASPLSAQGLSTASPISSRAPSPSPVGSSVESFAIISNPISEKAVPPSVPSASKPKATLPTEPPKLPLRKPSTASFTSVNVLQTGLLSPNSKPILPPRKAASLLTTPVSSPVTDQKNAVAPLLPPRPTQSPSLATTYPPSSQSLSSRASPAKSTPILRPKPVSNGLVANQPIASTTIGKQAVRKTRPTDPRARKRYQALWQDQMALIGPSAHEMPGLAVADIWMRSRLPTATLREIWYVKQ